MAWQDNIREAAYSSKSGKRQTFTYENVSKSIDKKTAAFDSPDADGTYIQDSGHTGRKFPLKLIFWGNNCDTEADDFEKLLLERGDGTLEHPIYGVIKVVPFGSINRKDDLVDGANQSIIELTFWETTGLKYPASKVDKKSAVKISSDILKVRSIDGFKRLFS